MGLIASLRRRLDRMLGRPQVAPADYWDRRVEKLGRKAVFDRRHSEDELDAVTAMQRSVLLPVLRERLDGSERTALDFGCGWGRFTHDIADTTRAAVVGIDPIPAMLRMAPARSDVLYVAAAPGTVPIATHSVDVAWIVLVLGCVTDAAMLARTAAELRRVLRPGALLLLAENTSAKPDLPHLCYRSVEAYRELFPEFDLRVVTTYRDIDEEITVLAGRSVF